MSPRIYKCESCRWICCNSFQSILSLIGECERITTTTTIGYVIRSRKKWNKTSKECIKPALKVRHIGSQVFFRFSSLLLLADDCVFVSVWFGVDCSVRLLHAAVVSHGSVRFGCIVQCFLKICQTNKNISSVSFASAIRMEFSLSCRSMCVCVIYFFLSSLHFTTTHSRNKKATTVTIT